MQIVVRPGFVDNPKAEAHARANGYVGPWPPLVRAMPENADDMMDIVGKIKKGEHRSTFATALERYTFSFFKTMTEEQFRRMARAAIDVARAEKNRPAIRARAAKLLINPLNKALKIMLKLEDATDTESLQHLQKCFRAYADELGRHGKEIQECGEQLFKMIDHEGGEPVNRLIGIEAIMDLILNTLDTIATVHEHDSRDLLLRTPIDRKSPKVISAYTEMGNLEEELRTKIQAEIGDCESA